jgi:hypothetical protein
VAERVQQGERENMLLREKREGGVSCKMRGKERKLKREALEGETRRKRGFQAGISSTVIRLREEERERERF